MNIRIFSAAELPTDHRAEWAQLQSENPSLGSPYFRPEFTQAVAAVRDDVEVAVWEDADRPVAFFPYERTSRGTGRPVGGRVSDFHGVIAAPGFAPDPLELLRACRLTSWRFHHLLCSQSSLPSCAWKEAASPYIDVSAGFQAYLDGRDNGRRLMSFYRKKKRNIERQFGPLRFEPHVADPAILRTCIEWKIDQYRRTNTFNTFGLPWAVKLLEHIFQADSESFAPMAAVLYAGDRVAAIDVGMRSRDVWHPWFPAYELEMATHSPGILHLTEMIKAAPELGIRRLDLGKGDEPYKPRYASDVEYVAEGALHARPLRGLIDRTGFRVKDRLRRRVRSSWLREPARRAQAVMFSTLMRLGYTE